MSTLRMLLLALAALLLAAPVAGAAKRGPCLVPGDSSTCDVWTGKVTSVADGDTLYVDVDGDGTKRPAYVRITGINTMEQTVYSRYAARRRGECHALEATARLEELIRRSKRRVRLIAQDASSRSGRRIRRAVAVRIGGRWRDVGRRMLAEGLALWLPNRAESLWNQTYSVLAQRAARSGRGLWNPTYCGAGPADGWPLQLWVSHDGQGGVDGEWIKIRNLHATAELPLGGWWVRDSGLRRYTLPSWATVPPGETITIYVGAGEDTWTEFFWGLRRTIFDSARSGPPYTGDGAYLFDPQGDLRAAMMYPCRDQCSDPNAGAIQISAKHRGREHVTLRNVAAHAIDLAPYRLESPPYRYAFSRDAVLAPGETMTIEIEGDPAEDSRLYKSWGETGPILNNGGDRIRLTSYTGIQLACYAFGTASC